MPRRPCCYRGVPGWRRLPLPAPSITVLSRAADSSQTAALESRGVLFGNPSFAAYSSEDRSQQHRASLVGSLATRASANMVYNHTRGAARAREHARLHLSRPLRPLPSLEALQRRCPGVRLSVARVPKTGSTHFLTGLSACKGTAVDLLWDHQAVPPTSCSRASLATLRDPCERFVSSYRHLKRAMKISYANTCALNSHLRTTDSHQT